MALLYIDQINPQLQQAFTNKVNDTAAYLGIRPEWLMQVMYAESRLNPQAQNRSRIDKHLIAAGLLQWTKASGLIGAPASVLSMGALEQLDHVKNYFAPYRGRLNSYFDVYLATFFPGAIGKNDNYVFESKKYSSKLIASQNPAVNINKDGGITMAEFKQYVLNSVPKKVKQFIFSPKDIAVAAGISGVAVAAFFFSLI